MDTFNRVFLLILVAFAFLLMVLGVAYVIHPLYVDLLGTPRTRESLMFTAVAGVGGAALVGLQFRGRWFEERTHLYGQWARGMQLLSESGVPDRLKGVEILLGLLEDSRWSYESKVLKMLANYLRENPHGPIAVEQRIVEAIGEIKSFGQAGVVRSYRSRLTRRDLNCLDLSGLVLNVPVVWKNMRFSCPVDFRGTVFSNSVDFSGTIFRDSVTFSSSRFCRNSVFDGVIFGGEVDCYDATFMAGASFESVNFCANASFRQAAFEGQVRFERTAFWGDVDFLTYMEPRSKSHNFKGGANFSSAVFYRDVYFGGRQRVSGEQTSPSIFDEPAIFNGAIFYGHSDFSGVLFIKSASFSSLRVGTRRPAPVRFYGSANFFQANLVPQERGRSRGLSRIDIFSGVIFERDVTFSFDGIGKSLKALEMASFKGRLYVDTPFLSLGDAYDPRNRKPLLKWKVFVQDLLNSRSNSLLAPEVK